MFQAMVRQHPNALMMLVGSGIGIVLAVVAFVGYGRRGAVDLDLCLMTGSAAGAYVGLLLGSGARSGRALPRKRTKLQ